ncbi:glycosyltransferase family 2 protein [Leptolyngbya ohadii]|uniref:glycosyltransferase family 2 protein n=1 Tax=Leptolyngbya ohadii TaxID=1962290 RepID=UPI0021F0C543|nr:glycosyltransferase family 2 protein [Leptolyngbya ohadii]
MTNTVTRPIPRSITSLISPGINSSILPSVPAAVSSMLERITPVILTYNEAHNIDRTLKQLTWAKRIVVIDSGSTDETLEILGNYPQVEHFQRSFDNHANQWNYGLQQVQTEWVLSLDADYCVSDELIAEMAQLSPFSPVNAYYARFKYCVFGQPLQATLLPPRAVLFRRDRATYITDGHTQLLEISGSTETLCGYIHHDDRKSLSRWIWAQDRYAILEAKKLRSTSAEQLSFGDRLRQYKVIAPFMILFYCLILHRGILDGWAGWYYAFQRVLAEILLSLHLLRD